MKNIILLIILTVFAIISYIWSSTATRIDSTDKVHSDIYSNANGTWNPQMEVTPFERAPSTMMTLRWQPPEETYNHFVVTISKADGTLVRKESGEHDRVALDLDMLESQTEYVFALQACLDSRCEQWLVAEEEYRGTTQASETKEETK